MKKLHTNSVIFFPKPHVIYVKYANISTYDKDHRELVKNTYNLVSNTWGYSSPDIIYMLANDDNFSVKDTSFYRAYFCFSNELDVSQFRLSIRHDSHKALIWPEKLKFTIHEYT